MALTGDLFIGAARVATSQNFAATDPATGQELAVRFSAAGAAEIARACGLAASVFDRFREMDLEVRARFLETIGDNILALGDALLERAGAETGLPRVRLEGERGRTIGQLRLFAQLVRRGDWLGLRVDPPLPERKPLPRVDLRQRKIPVGPVAVFGASNFPLAFSVAGGDTASALAAGCPVVVKGHPAHPGTSELVAGAIVAAAQSCGLPDGVFSLLNGPDIALGAGLVSDPRIKAVGFTGSRHAGLALLALAQSRPEPIPLFAEMSSINPVLLLPGALAQRAEGLGQGFAGSLTLGVGQFCTNPGLILALEGPDLERFTAAAVQALTAVAPGVMLTGGIRRAYVDGVGALASHAAVPTLLAGGPAEGVTCSRPALFSVSAADFLAHPALSHEVFGASSLIVRCPDEAALSAVLEGLEGQLTITVHLDPADQKLAGRLLPVLERKAGRILANGWPTGVEVSPAMVHGGPFPATSDGRTSSVGTLAIDRFLRPVCYQDIPEALLPASLHGDNPLHFARLIDGVPTSGSESR